MKTLLLECEYNNNKSKKLNRKVYLFDIYDYYFKYFLLYFCHLLIYSHKHSHTHNYALMVHMQLHAWHKKKENQECQKTTNLVNINGK